MFWKLQWHTPNKKYVKLHPPPPAQNNDYSFPKPQQGSGELKKKKKNFFLPGSNPDDTNPLVPKQSPVRSPD